MSSMNPVVVLFGLIVFDRAIPAGAFRFTNKVNIDPEVYMKRYGLVRFPRTALGVASIGVVLVGRLLRQRTWRRFYSSS